MQLKWSSKAVSDLGRLFDFLAPVDKRAAAKTIQTLSAAPNKIIDQPRLGERLEMFEPKEVRRLVVGKYEIRYEIAGETVHVLRVWHTRERR
ncbi:type II toxin-antitoxin system RelE/ParE family toxin [Endozoicomonas sp. SM1973]|uniref:Type II toxin-antitoxin system RelE/ParE family toxin n=1 Tax=Spartinivicinus marinus TaxID=2994442 RepID=A0A853I8Z9_9GAMM|nr:type II toxin-antitoxin system RelE/ParE family toxin [Spartinivicinus marinus]NYZ69783.1 type II toxin-antitoxin system RelE/ParE family toxin [Spartinivicinus marinus]